MSWGLLVLPFFSWPHFSPYEVPKTWLIVGLASSSFVVAILTNRFQEKQKTNNALIVGMVGLMGWLFLSSLLAGDFWQSWWGNAYRGDGLLTLLAMLVLGLTLPSTDKQTKLIAISSMGLALSMIVQRKLGAGLTMGNPNMVAGYCALTLPMFQGWGKWGWVTVLLVLVAIGMTGSWGGILVGVSWVVYVLLRRYPKLLYASLVVVVIGVAGLYNHEYRANAKPGYIVAESRSRILTKAMIAISQKPVLGWGWAQFDQAFAQIDYPTHYLVDAYVDRTHSSILEFGVAGGIPALILYIGILGISIVALLSSKHEIDHVLGYVLLLYLVLSQTNITSVAADWLMWWGVGRAISLPLRGRRRRLN